MRKGKLCTPTKAAATAQQLCGVEMIDKGPSGGQFIHVPGLKLSYVKQYIQTYRRPTLEITHTGTISDFSTKQLGAPTTRRI